MAAVPAIPPWLTGRHVSAVIIQPLSVDNSGIFSPEGTPLDLTVLIDEIDYNGRQTTQNVVRINSVQENYVPIEIDDSFTLTEILASSHTTSYNKLSQVWLSGVDYALLTVTRGGNSFDFYGLIADYNETFRKGKSTGQMTVAMVSLIDSDGTGHPIGLPLANPDYTT